MIYIYTFQQNEVQQAVMAVHQLSKQGKVIVSLASSEPLVNALIKVLKLV
jgi:hypothetical protein